MRVWAKQYVDRLLAKGPFRGGGETQAEAEREARDKLLQAKREVDKWMAGNYDTIFETSSTHFELIWDDEQPTGTAAILEAAQRAAQKIPESIY